LIIHFIGESISGGVIMVFNQFSGIIGVSVYYLIIILDIILSFVFG